MAECDDCQCTRCQVSRSLQRSYNKQDDRSHNIERQINTRVVRSKTQYSGKTGYGDFLQQSNRPGGRHKDRLAEGRKPKRSNENSTTSDTLRQSLPSDRGSNGLKSIFYTSMNAIIGGATGKISDVKPKTTVSSDNVPQYSNQKTHSTFIPNPVASATKPRSNTGSSVTSNHRTHSSTSDTIISSYSGEFSRSNFSGTISLHNNNNNKTSNHSKPISSSNSFQKQLLNSNALQSRNKTVKSPGPVLNPKAMGQTCSELVYSDSYDYLRSYHNFIHSENPNVLSEVSSSDFKNVVLGSRSYSAFSSISGGNFTYVGRHENICSIFWKIGLVCCNFKHGDRPVEFTSFWPSTEEMETLLWESYCSASLKKCVLDLCRLSICCGPVCLLRSLLSLNILGVNTKLESGETLLHLSCIAQNAETTRLLCAKGANKQAADKQGRTPIQVCHSRSVSSIIMSPSPANPVVTPYPVTIKKQSLTLYDKEILFEMATSCTELDDLLLKLQTYDFDVNAEVNENGDFLIHAAVREGLCQLPLIMQLVKKYFADIDLPNRAGQTPLMITAENGDHVLADVLLCVMNANPDIQTVDQGYTALHYSCQHNHVDTTHTLLKRGADFNQQDKKQQVADDVAVKLGHVDCSDLIQIHRKDRISQLNQLISQDELSTETMRVTDMYNPDPDTGFTLIMLAAKLNKVHSLRVLLGGDNVPINAQHEKSMQTALSFAADEGNIEAMRILLQNGCIPGILDIERLIPVHHGVRNNRVEFVTELLRQPGCLLGLELSLKLCQTEDMKKVIRAAMNRRQREIVTPVLLECAMTGDAEKLYCTLEEGDCLNPVSSMGQWPLYLAVENQHMAVIKLLCQNGADLKRRHTSTGNTVLHLASARGFFDITQFLLQCYMSEWSVLTRDPEQIIHTMNYDGKTALMLAADQGHSKLVALLLHHGSSTSVLSPQGELYSCHHFQGCQSLLEKNRNHHTKLVFSALLLRDGLKKLQQIFLPKLDHTLRDDRGNTPLMVACHSHHQSVVRFLLQSSVYVMDHSKSFCGSFTRTFMSNLSGSDSGKHTSQENVDGCQDSCSCLNNNNTKDKTAFVDSVVGVESLEPCKFCIGNSQENLYSLENGSQNTKQQQMKNSVLNSSIDTTGLRTGTEVAINEKLEIVDGTERCPCSKCSNISQTSESNLEEIRRNSSLETILRKSSPFEESVPEEEEYEQQIKDNMSALFSSISSVNNRGSIFVTEIMISHLCAINLLDGATCFHRLVEGGDNVVLLEALLDTDHTGVNIQDNLGLTPLHLACQLVRKKIVQKLTSLPYVDLNSRTLDGKLAEEMTTDKNIHKLVLRARNQEPVKSVLSPLMSLSTSMFGVGSYNSMETTSVDFDQTNAQFLLIKQQMQQPTQYLDESTMMMTSVHF